MPDVSEAEVLAASAAGVVVDCGSGGARRSVEAGLIRRFCRELRDQVDPRGLRLSSASVGGSLDLAGLDVPFPLVFSDCEFDSPVIVEGARLYGLALMGCPEVPGLLANGVRVRRDLELSGSHIAGRLRTSASTSNRSAIWLCESKIGGRLLCADTVIDGGERSIQADRMRVTGNVRLLHQFTARGEVRMIGARIGGSLDLTGARIESPVTGLALDLGEAVIDGSVFLIGDTSGRCPVIQGRIDMGGARIGGQFLLRSAMLAARGALPVGSAYSRSRSGGTALSAPRLSVGAELTLEGTCDVNGGIDLSMSELSNLSIGPGCALRAAGSTALDLTHATVISSVVLGRKVAVQGTIRLVGAQIHGTLELRDITLSDPERRALISAIGANVDGDVDLRDMRATGGRLRFANTTVGTVLATRAQLVNPGDFTLSLHQATVKGSVVLNDGFTSCGPVILDRVTIGGRLDCDGGAFTCPVPVPGGRRDHAIEATSATIRGGMHLGWTEIAHSVDFTDTVTTFLVDDPDNWPPSFAISGFAYDRFGYPQTSSARSPWDHAARCAWLGRQLAYDAGPYEQAARVFRQHGYTDGAKAILIAQHRHARDTIQGRGARSRRAISAVHGITVGYGYRPARVLWLLLALLTLVTVSLQLPATQAAMRATSITGVIYTTRGPTHAAESDSRGRPVNADPRQQPDVCGNGLVRCFSPLLYAIDTVVPLISLDQRATWYPDAHRPYGTFMQWWLNLATILGWLLSSIFVLALAGLARSP